MKAQILSLLLRAIASTWRIRVHGALPKAPGVVAFWHGNMLPIWYAFAGTRSVGMASVSKDGALLHRLLKDWGYATVRGSSSKGGRTALDDMIVMATTRLVLVTPDGPRGPAKECKPGCVVVAQRAQVPLTLIHACAAKAKYFPRSWDNFMLPLPFTSISLHIAPPMVISTEIADLNDTMLEVTKRLNELGDVSC